MALAKYFRDKGNRLQAFYILETARRGRFEEDEFNKAFALAFRGSTPPDYSPAAEAALLKEHARDPNTIDAIVKLADIYISREDWARAKEYISRAIRLQPEDFGNIEALAEVLRREGKLEEADRLLQEYARSYPETLDGYRLRIAEVSEKQPDKAKPLLSEAIKKFPQEGSFVFDLGTISQREGKLQEAEDHFVRAAEMSPDSVYIQAWVGRFFYKVKNDNRRALDYYLNAYLLDPHAYETEFVESRIPKTNAVVAKANYEQQLKSGVPLTKIIEDPNPDVVYSALEQMSAKWEPAYLKILVDLMGHDDGGVRWYATQMINEKVDRSFDETLSALLKDQDLRKRGLAAYIAVHLWKQESFAIMRDMLKEESQILRFDAVSALFLEGGEEGRKIVLEHLSRESHPKLKKLIEAAMKKEKSGPEELER
ncbi:MAG TPA: tetratricopeptide repeat protein [Pyrinomonadaceae bacterium]|nr:tetratricopeptide repeat protein [Pyrinomonadaceae bacterium]